MGKFFCVVYIFILTGIFMTAETLADSPSGWAEKEVGEAIEKGIVPIELQEDYTKNITRGEFCKLCMATFKAWGKDVHFKHRISFSDTDDEEILECAEIGIVDGVGDHKFAPNNPIKRQEAARMLYQTLFWGTSVIDDTHNYKKTSECCIPHSFDDGGLFKSWARNEINHMYRYGVMLGVSDNNYEPDGYYTREQAICTFLRLYNCQNDVSLNPVPESDYYPYGDSVYKYYDDGMADAETDDGEDYHISYIDSGGNKYTEKEKGYVYPFNMPYAALHTFSGMWDVKGTFRIWDKNGNDYGLTLSNVYRITPEYIFGTRYEDYTLLLHRFSDGKEFFDVVDMGEDLFIELDETSVEENKPIRVINANGDIIVDYSKGYIFTSKKATAYNGIFVLENKDGFFSVINSKGEILKNFNVNSNWTYDESVGSNMKFYTGGYGKVFYRAMSGKYFTYDSVTLTDNNEAIVYNVGGSQYILNADGTVKFECDDDDSVEKINGFDFYKIGCMKNGSAVCEIVNKSGNVIKTIRYDELVGGNIYFDKSGVCAYTTFNNSVKFFDFFGDDLKEVDLNDYKNKDKIISYSSLRFINGLLWVRTRYSDSGEYDDFYITPYGKVLR